ncbi:Histidine ammonia-lyase [Balamuthia mandrillaris]
MESSSSSSEDSPVLLLLDGETLTIEQLLAASTGKLKLGLTEEAWQKVDQGRKVVDNVLASGKTVYGINTGFGKFCDVVISGDKLASLQSNLIRSHAAGVGEPLSPQRVRMMMVLRINVLAKGHSGISRQTLSQYIDAFNASCLSFIPCKGTLGASGDLAPLSHLALGLMGEGKMWDPAEQTWGLASEVLPKFGLSPLELQAKEGLALINGTQFITSLGAEAIHRCLNATRTADIIAALTLEALKGTVAAFKEEIHKARPHKGQGRVAANLRALLHSTKYPSEIALSHANCNRVQDSYTLRCVPQVHGVVYDTIDFVHSILETEMNSATDNPMVFPESNGLIVSGGNFHGEYPAKVLDYLAIAIHEIGNMSERRIERLCNNSLSALPPFLVKEGGLNSGFMIAHCTAAALVSENKALCHPSSVDSISTSAAQEDHVSMGGWAARKALSIVENVEMVLAVELLAACQGLDFLRPLTSTEPLEKVYTLVRNEVASYEKDRFIKPDIDQVTKLIQSGKIWHTLHSYLPTTTSITYQ